MTKSGVGCERGRGCRQPTLAYRHKGQYELDAVRLDEEPAREFLVPSVSAVLVCGAIMRTVPSESSQYTISECGCMTSTCYTGMSRDATVYTFMLNGQDG